MDEKKLQKIRTLMIVFSFFLVQAFLFFPPALAFSPTCASRRNAVVLSCSMRHLSLG